MTVGVIRRKPVFTRASIVCGMLASVNSMRRYYFFIVVATTFRFLLKVDVSLPFSVCACVGFVSLEGLSVISLKYKIDCAAKWMTGN